MRKLTPEELVYWSACYPEMDMRYVRITLEEGEEYNCVAYAVGEEEHEEPETVAKMRPYFLSRGFYEVPAGSAGADIDLLGKSVGAQNTDKVYVNHVTRKFPGGRPFGVPLEEELWESKIGPYFCAMTHRRKDLCVVSDELAGGGNIIASFKRR